jgi:hypothetical protein
MKLGVSVGEKVAALVQLLFIWHFSKRLLLLNAIFPLSLVRRMIGAEDVRSPAGLAGQVRPRLRTHRNVTPQAKPASAASD